MAQEFILVQVPVQALQVQLLNLFVTRQMKNIRNRRMAVEAVRPQQKKVIIFLLQYVSTLKVRPPMLIEPFQTKVFMVIP